MSPRGREGVVEPLVLGAPGVSIESDGRQYALAAGVPGDRVRFLPPWREGSRRRGARGGSSTLARRLEVLAPGPGRLPAVACGVLERCGACALQELRYARQLVAKTQALRAALAALGARPESVSLRGLELPFGYRTKLSMAAGGAAGRLRFGFYSRGSFGEPVPAEGCPVQHPLTLATLAMVTQTLDAAGVPPTSAERPRSGWLHGLVIRVDPLRAAAEVTLIAKNERIPGGGSVAQSLAALPGVEALHLNVNPKRSSYAFGETFLHLGGARRMTFTLGGQSLALSPGSFFQTCQAGAELLVEAVLEALPPAFRALADLYGGVGVFSRLSAGRWERAVVAELSAHAIADLRASLASDDKATAGAGKLALRVIPGRVEQTVRRALEGQPDCVLLDPPRRGCQPAVLGEIGRVAPELVIYVACGIEALLRDGARLRSAGYRIDTVQAIDMFPHTPHLEVVTRFRRA